MSAMDYRVLTTEDEKVLERQIIGSLEAEHFKLSLLLVADPSNQEVLNKVTLIEGQLGRLNDA